jgi:hypothetical protein
MSASLNMRSSFTSSRRTIFVDSRLTLPCSGLSKAALRSLSPAGEGKRSCIHIDETKNDNSRTSR